MLDCCDVSYLICSQVSDGKVHFIKFFAPWCGEHNRTPLTLLSCTDAASFQRDLPPAACKLCMSCAGHCKKLAPTWSELADSYKGSDQVTIAQVDCTTAKASCDTAAVTGYPTLKAFYSGTEHAVYRGAQSASAGWPCACVDLHDPEPAWQVLHISVDSCDYCGIQVRGRWMR